MMNKQTHKPKLFVYADENGDPKPIRLWRNLHKLEVADGITGPNFRRLVGPDFDHDTFWLPATGYHGDYTFTDKRVFIRERFQSFRKVKIGEPRKGKPIAIFDIWIRTK